MICTENMSNERGSITVAAALILCCVIILNITLYDYVSFKVCESRNEAKLRLACNSVLASFDGLLADEYGLYGFNSGSGSTPESLFLRYYDATECEIILSENFTEPAVLEAQICDLMKLKTPVAVTEMILEAIGVISKAEQKGDDFEACGNAADFLTKLQSIQNELKIKVEGLYSGDPICVNGYSQAFLNELIQTVINQKDELTEDEIVEFLDKAIFLNEQYMDYNNEAALLCKKLDEGAELIGQMLSESSEYEDVNGYVSEIKKQAAKISSSSAAKEINKNIEIFMERIDYLNAIKNKNIAFVMSDIKNILEKKKINTDIKINIIYAENSSGMHGDEQQNILKTQIKDKFSAVILSEDTYVIPSLEYASLPSNRTGATDNPEFNTFTFNTESLLNSFSEFKSMFNCWSNISFENILENTAENILIDSYISEYMSNRMSAPSKMSLNNEIEYILEGNASCEENNNTVEKKIVSIRFIVNFIEIINDLERSAVAENIARSIAAAVSMGVGVTMYKLIIISAWALIDSYSDLGELLLGESVPIVKIGKDTEEFYTDEIQDYSFYLRLLLFLTPKETKLMRICDIIEIGMSGITGMAYRLSGVYNKMSANVKTPLNFISPILLGYEKDEYYGEMSCEVQY